MDKGWIKLHRKIQDSVLWKDPEKLRAWIDILLMVNHEDRKVLIGNKVVTIHAGQHHSSVIKLSSRWGWSRNRTYNFLRLLEDLEMITTSGTTVGTTISVINWEFYQSCDTTIETTDGTPNGTTNGTQTRMIKNDIKRKETLTVKEKKDEFFDDEELNRAFEDYRDMRKAIKKPMTPRAAKLAMNTLTKLAGDDKELKIKILEQSTFNSWQGLFALRDEKGRKKVPDDMSWAEGLE